MVFGLFDTGEELVLENFFGDAGTRPASLSVGVYQDRDWYVANRLEYNDVTARNDTGKGDVLDQDDDVGSINTEPQGAAYGRQTVDFGTGFTVEKVGGDWRARMADVTFDFSDSDAVVNALFLVANYQSDDAGDGTANDHLLASIRLSNERDLSIEDGELTFKRAGLGLSSLVDYSPPEN